MKEIPRIIRAASYSRIANAQHLDKLQAQEEAIFKFIAHNPEICLVRAYEDIGPGLETYRLPWFCRMIHDAFIAKDFDLIIVQDISRLSRDYVHLISLLSGLKKNDIEVYSITDNRVLTFSPFSKELSALIKAEAIRRAICSKS